MTPNRYALATIWLGVVLFLGTAYFATTTTAPFILPLLKKLAPGASNAQLHATHRVLRKLTHVAEYALLALLWFWAIVARTGRHSFPRVPAACGTSSSTRRGPPPPC